MVTCLAPSLGLSRARLRLHARLDPDGRVIPRWFGGDSSHPDVERHARAAFAMPIYSPCEMPSQTFVPVAITD